MQAASILISCFTLVSAVCADTADNLARAIIQEEAAGAHNVSDDTHEELKRATAANSRLRLKWLMLNQVSVTEELRICYAIRVIDDKLGLHKILRSGINQTPEENELAEKRLILADRLIELDKNKKQNKSEQATPRKPSD